MREDVNMGGKEARGGFWFQDAKALTRLLADAIERRRRHVLGVDLGPELRVRIESAVEIVVEASEETPAEVPPRPIWDGTFARGDLIVVDECKLGGPTRNDRVTFYRRLRATIAVGVPLARLVPRITVGRGSIENLDRWTGLAEAAQTTTTISTPPPYVDDVEKLAAEAVYYLTTPKPVWSLKRNDDDGKKEVPPTPALSLEDARALLSRFEIDADSSAHDLELELRAQLDALGGSLPSDELIDLLGGWLARIARASSWHDDLTADSLSEKLALVALYLALDPETVHLWHRLRATSPPPPVTRIADQPWRDLQPQVGPIIRDRSAHPRVVLTSEGGIGKSHLLGDLWSEQLGTRVWVDTVAPGCKLEEAIALGAWAAMRTGEQLTVFVDAIDQAADPAGLLKTIEHALVKCDRAAVYASARLATWTSTRDVLTTWHDVRLSRWTEQRIRALADAGRTQPLSPDLIDLLRTPLLLDLFLRTFAAADAIPNGLATRHGVLRAYFDRRVYADEHAGARRTVLDAGMDAVLANHATWRDSIAAQGLVSEGVVVRTFGMLRFRHALLRDFSAALHLAPRPAIEIAGALRSVESPIVRNELLRGIIEAQLDPDPIVDAPPLFQLVHECTAAGLAPGIALGTTDAPTAALLDALAPLDGGSVLRQALAYAHLIENRAWLRTPSALGGLRPSWLGETQLQGLASLAELALATEDIASHALASTLRAWTSGRLGSDAASWSAATLGGLLVRTLPDDATADWFAGLSLGETGFRAHFLEHLRDLGATAQVSDAALLRALDNVVFGEGSHVIDGGHSLWEVTNLCLSNHDGKNGLLTTRPYVALTLVFALSVAKQRAEDRDRAAFIADPRFVELWAKQARAADLVEAEVRLRIEPTLTEAEALGELVDDAPSTDRHSFDYLESVIDQVEQRAADDLRFAEQLGKASLTSLSSRARIMVLELSHGGRVVEVVDEILRDPRVYHVLYASGALWDAINARWRFLSDADRSTVQQNVLARGRSPLLRFTSVGRLASAIPNSERDVKLQPYVDFLEATGRSTEPVRPARVERFRNSSRAVDEDDAETLREPTTARLEELAKDASDELAIDQAIALLEQERGTLSVETPDRTWSAISVAVGRDERRPKHVLQSASARALFETALASIEARRSEPDRWATLLDLADACPSYVGDPEALGMRARLIDEVVVGAGENAERAEHAYRALLNVRPIAWLGEGTGGREVFDRWFRDCLHGDGLRQSKRFLEFIPGVERIELVCHVLETNERLHSADARAFINDAGRMLAPWALWWNQPFARDRLQRLCDASIRPGSLATAEAWRWLLSGFAWGLQNELRHARPDTRAAPGLARFVPLLEITWSAWSKVIDDTEQDGISVGWSVTAPLGHEFTTKVQAPIGGWSSILRDLLPRLILDGGRNDIAAFQQVDWRSVDPQTLVLIANAAIARSDREITSKPATDLMVDSLVEILLRAGRLSTLALQDARRVLDSLQRLGRRVPRAINAAILVEREVRARESVPSY